EQGTGYREQGTGNMEQGTGYREQGTGYREQVLSNFTFPYLCRFFRSPTYQLPITHYQLPITHYLSNCIGE
ncbi:hypothetical protein, partial [Dolichospermum circinale]|uniref:hypothetical protein n=1 Tax=Dolichospermum circinale TaxID=109265 RepID=UPI00232B3AC9